MQGRARGRKGERKTYHITILYIYKYHVQYVSNWLFVSYPSFLPCTLVTFEIG